MQEITAGAVHAVRKLANKKNLVISTKFSLQIIFFWGRIVFVLLSKPIGTPGLEPAARLNGSCSLPIGEVFR